MSTSRCACGTSSAVRLPRPGPISITVSAPGELERVDDALEDSPVVEKVLAEALSHRRMGPRGSRPSPRRRHVGDLRSQQNDRQIVAPRRRRDVRIEHLEHAVEDRRRRLVAMRADRRRGCALRPGARPCGCARR